jgi:tetratricopeptide (TPR) repeat protein
MPDTLPPLRVEQALQLLPDVEALAPLRGMVVSSSRSRPSTELHCTVGKRHVEAALIRARIADVVADFSGHIADLYDAAVEALECEQRDDSPRAVRALLRAGDREWRVGRESQARVWYQHALRIAEGLRERGPEIETLWHLGELDAAWGRFDDAARFHQRSFALAETELDFGSAARACAGLGDIALAHGTWQGAASWFARGLQYAAGDQRLKGLLSLGCGEVGRLRGELQVAEEWFRRAREAFERTGDAEGIVRVLNAWGQLETDRGRYVEALASFREALAGLRGGADAPMLEMAIRLNGCRLYMAWDRLPDAEDEIRLAEETAVTHNFTHQLARVYMLLGYVRRKQGDEAGFVFFEKAIELCRGRQPALRLEAEAYLAYSRFLGEMGDRDESRAYRQRALAITEALGDGPILSQNHAEPDLLEAR